MRYMYILLASLLCLVFISSGAIAEDAFMPRYPAISPDGETFVFSFQGDLWSVPAEGGQAYRLTAHPAYDSHPVFSNDGTMIAYGSDRYGDVDVFVIPASGGIPTRLTYAETTDEPYAFSPDGERVYFASSRLFDYPMDRQIQYVPTDGGTPFRLADMFGDEIAVSPDGEKYVIAQGRLKFGRIMYRGTYQRDLYEYREGQAPVQLTAHNGVDTEPMIHPDGTIYWVSDADTYIRNVWAMNADGSNKRRITDFDDDGIRTASLCADGSRMVVERRTSLYTIDLPDGEPREMNIQVAADLVENPQTIETYTSQADEIAVSADGEEYAMIIKGDIVLVNKELGGRAVVPIPDPAREHDISFRPGEGADTLAFVTDRFGEKTLCLLVSDDPETENLREADAHKIVKLTDGKTAASRPEWSPSGDRIMYTHGNGDIYIMDHDGGSKKALVEHWSMSPDYAWSPNGFWVAYSNEDRNFNSDIRIISADGGEAVNISQHPDSDWGPVWADDGSMLAWTSRRHGNQYDVYFVYLTEELEERTREEWEIWEKTRDKPKKEENGEEDGEDGAEEEEEPAPEPIQIDFEDIHLRIHRVTSGPEGQFAVAVHPRGDKIFYKDGESVMAVNRFGKDEEEIASGDPSSIHLLNETFYFLTHGKPGYVSMDGGSVETTDFRARIETDKVAMRKQVIDEGWRELGSKFYDPGMHGVDWKALRKKYTDWATKVRHNEDFADVVNLMLGELNASHMGYYPDWPSPGSDQPDDGWIGVEWDPAYTGSGLRVKWVLPKGPADEADVGLQTGDIVYTINGIDVGIDTNVFMALEHQQDIPLPITWERDGEEMEAEIVPIGWRQIVQLTYEYLEKTNRAFVEETSDDRVGYVHIQGMSMPEVERFEMNLYAAADDKDALIIDVRNNGGGWTTDMLMTILTQPVHAFTIARDGEVGYPQPRYPLYRWEKPVAVICNEGSYSNAEIFSHAIKTIDRGPVIGTETGGNVISTGGWTTLDGNWIRLPFRGWYVWGDEQDPSRNNKNQEAPGEGWGGAVPDYPIPFGPADRIGEWDPQLNKAIDLMVEAAQREARKSKPISDPDKLNYNRPLK